MASNPKYDFAFSFAGEHRDYVEKTKLACDALGLKVFYDKDKNNEWWGSNFISKQREAYGSSTRYFVPFISPEYFQKAIPSDEFESAMMTAVRKGDDYILPVVIGDPVIPQTKLYPHTHYLRAKDYSPEQLAQELKKHLNNNNTTEDIATVVNEAVDFQMPKIIPREFSKYQEIDIILDYLESQFKAAIKQLYEQSGVLGIVKRKDDLVMVRLERNNRTIYSLNIFQGGMSDDSSLGFNYERDSTNRNSYTGIGTPYFDLEAGVAKIELMNISLVQGDSTMRLTKDELFQALWSRLIQDIERIL